MNIKNIYRERERKKDQVLALVENAESPFTHLYY